MYINGIFALTDKEVISFKKHILKVFYARLEKQLRLIHRYLLKVNYIISYSYFRILSFITHLLNLHNM